MGVYYREVSVGFPFVFLRKSRRSCCYNNEIKQERRKLSLHLAKTAKWAGCPGLLRRRCSEERDGSRGEGPLELDCLEGPPSLANSWPQQLRPIIAHCVELSLMY